MSKLGQIFSKENLKKVGGWLVMAALAKAADVLLGFNLITIENFSWLLKSLIGILNFPIKLGIVLWGCLCIGVSYFVIQGWIKGKNERERPVFLEYTSQVFDDVLYKWEYVYIEKQYRIGKLIPYCPSCDCRIVSDRCVNCTDAFLGVKDRQESMALIRHAIRIKYQIDEFEVLGE